jgi:hypothetical protein
VISCIKHTNVDYLRKVLYIVEGNLHFKFSKWEWAHKVFCTQCESYLLGPFLNLFGHHCLKNLLLYKDHRRPYVPLWPWPSKNASACWPATTVSPPKSTTAITIVILLSKFITLNYISMQLRILIKVSTRMVDPLYPRIE